MSVDSWEKLTLFAEDSPASRSVSQVSDSGGTTSGETCSGTPLSSRSTSKRTRSSSRTYPASLQQIRDALSARSSLTWPKQGLLTSSGELLIPSFSESPNVVRECSLSQVLETSVDDRYLLSEKACAGILRRAERRGRSLPVELKAALESVAG